MPLNFKVGEVPRTKPFQFADLAELLVLMQVNAQVSKADLESLIATGNADSDPDEESRTVGAVDVQLKHERNHEDCFRQLSYRNDALDATYPFAVNGALLSAKARISDLGYIYLFLLICSRLGSFSGVAGWHQGCARLFALVAAESLRSALNGSATVYVFDAGSEDRAKHFHTNLRQALPLLAAKLNALAVHELVNQQDAHGDGGLDLVAIQPPGDKAMGLVAYFGQCAAQKEGWPKKTLEATKVNAFFNMGHEAFNLLYTPVMYRKATGGWVNDLHTYNCVVIDRLRLLKTLDPVAPIPVALLHEVRVAVNAAAAAATR